MARPPATDGSGHDAAIRAVLRASADPSGFLPFDRFMEIALYAEGVGYYARPGIRLGPSGDFYTAPRVHPLFGRTIAAHLSAVRRQLGLDRPFSVLELGPGDGTLGASVLPALDLGPEGSAAVEYGIVERSATLAAVARERLEPLARARGIGFRWAESLGELGPFEGAVLANELLDAQPARRLRWSGAEWVELGVRFAADRLVEAEAPLVTPAPGPPLPVPETPGTVLEISPAAEATIREVADHLARGVGVFLDYGGSEEELLLRHPEGTLAALAGHRFVEDPLDAPGAVDLSTFVNFSRIRSVARAARLRELSYLGQAEALGQWGFPALFEHELRSAGSAEAEVRLRFAVKNLLFGFDRFRVLELAAGPAPEAVPAVT